MGEELGGCGAIIRLKVKVGTKHRIAGQREVRVELKRN